MNDHTVRARELARNAADLIGKHDKALGDVLVPIRTALGIGPDADARLLAVLQEAVEVADDAAALEVFRAATVPAPLLQPAHDFATAPQPRPILWHDQGKESDGTNVDAVLSVGEVALLASAGGLGKSTVVLEVTSVAVRTHAAHRENPRSQAPYGTACGLRVMAGPVALVSYEDAPARIAHRLRWINENAVPPGLHLWPDPEPLWVAASDRGGESHAGNQWDALWREIRAIGARLVVVDPVSAALADVSTTETGPVRAFLRALTREAAPDEAAGWQGCGVLLVAHDTKAARNALARGEDPGAGVVAGSAAWYDGARGVLSLMRVPIGEDRLLECVKANYGRTGWGARLTERTGHDGAYRGLELVKRLDRSGLETAKEKPGKRGTDANGAGQPATDGPGRIP